MLAALLSLLAPALEERAALPTPSHPPPLPRGNTHSVLAMMHHKVQGGGGRGGGGGEGDSNASRSGSQARALDAHQRASVQERRTPAEAEAEAEAEALGVSAAGSSSSSSKARVHQQQSLEEFALDRPAYHPPGADKCVRNTSSSSPPTLVAQALPH
jgi:hypothetical protein